MGHVCLKASHNNCMVHGELTKYFHALVYVCLPRPLAFSNIIAKTTFPIKAICGTMPLGEKGDRIFA